MGEVYKIDRFETQNQVCIILYGGSMAQLGLHWEIEHQNDFNIETNSSHFRISNGRIYLVLTEVG